MASLKRKLKRGSYVILENPVTNDYEVFRKGSHSLIYSGIRFQKPKSKIKL
jgi:hypothetical protein